ncbi:hypothetical protein Goklo_015822, partial [Gossypium klotzschianum]|nr:hypothetical protein [Gossypium klotzschianum]
NVKIVSIRNSFDQGCPSYEVVAETLIHALKYYPILHENEAIKKWEKPPKGIVKINFDASINLNRMGYGVIIQDDDGFVLGGGGGFIDKRVLVHEVECIAFERSIKLTCQLNCYW